ncbi:unnamed protein product [Soboliphyme baturini]|uniref:Thyroglobulin type-1 domain-containing protein n=1 Tax=Soboliphyme baturini TaxID=241478 RepID=A0A183IK13_9BILA|nr:unnamed protein product [Soboliphyme baturini]
MDSHIAFVAAALMLALCYGDEQSNYEFRSWHDFLTSTNADQWESHEAQLNKMCLVMSRDEWPSFVPLRQHPSKPDYKLSRIFRYQSQEDRNYHVQQVKRCCRKETLLDRRDCFDQMIHQFLDDYCNTGTNFICCRYEGFKLEVKGPTGEIHEEDKNLLINAMMDLDNEGPQCMSNYFPENNLHLLKEENIENETCPKRGYQQTGCEAQACCTAGAYDGRHKLQPHQCPYFQCRAFYKDFYNAHNRCIRHRFFCGFFYISCCERQFYK